MSIHCAAIAPEVAYNGQWAKEAFIGQEGGSEADVQSAAPANQLILVKEETSGDTKINRAHANTNPIRLRGTSYSHGIASNAPCVVRVELEKKATRFLADIGVDDNMGPGTIPSVNFQVVADGKDLYASPVMEMGSKASIDVALDGVRVFDLVMGDGGDGGDGRSCDQGNWADARVELEDGTVLWLDELPRTRLGDQVVSKDPFSFIYGGKSSREFLDQWTKNVNERTLEDGTLESTITWLDPETGLEVRAVVKTYTDTAGVDWTLYFKNTGSADSPVLEQVRAVDVIFPEVWGPSGAVIKEVEYAQPVYAPVLHRITGTFCNPMLEINEFQPIEQPLTRGQAVEFGTESAHSSLYEAFPYFNLQRPEGGVITALGWTGAWVANVAYEANGTLNLGAGMRHLHLSLHPGEEIRSPRVLQLHWLGSDLEGSYNLFRQTMFKHIMPKINGKNAVPPIAHSTEAFGGCNATTEADEHRFIDHFKDFGFETYWLDAWWIKGGFPAGIGNWGFPIERAMDPVRFPNGVRSLSDQAHASGRKFIMWFSPEGIGANSALAPEHPEWVLTAGPATTEDKIKGGGMFDLSNPEAAAYMTRYMKTVIEEYGIDIFRNDSGGSLPAMHYKDGEPNRVGITEIRSVEGLYKMWDDLLTAFPNLQIDNCCGGGTRLDLEISARSISLWRTDVSVGAGTGQITYDENAKLGQSISASLNRYVPFSQNGTLGSTPYRIRSSFNGGMTFCDIENKRDYSDEELKAGIVEMKRIRKYLFGNYYALDKLSVDNNLWCVMQYHRPEQGDGLVMAFRRDESPYAAFQLALREIDPEADYTVETYRTYDLESSKTMKGADLAAMPVTINEKPGSLLIEYRKK